MDEVYKIDETLEVRYADDDMFNIDKIVQNFDDHEISSTDAVNKIIKRFELIEDQINNEDVETACENCKRIHILFDEDCYLTSPIAKWGGLIKMYDMIGFLPSPIEAMAPLMVMEKMLYFSEFARQQFFDEGMNENMTGYVIEGINNYPDVVELQLILWSILNDLSDSPSFCEELAAAVPPEWVVNHAAVGPERVLGKVCYLAVQMLQTAAGGVPYALTLLGVVPHMVGRGEVHLAMCAGFQALVEREDAELQEALTSAFFAGLDGPALLLSQADAVRALWALSDEDAVADAAEREARAGRRPPSHREALDRRRRAVLSFLRMAQHLVTHLDSEDARSLFPYVEVADIAIGTEGPDNVFTPVALRTLGFFAARGPECALLVLAETPVFQRLTNDAYEAPFRAKAELLTLFLECIQAVRLGGETATQLIANEEMWELVISGMANGARELEHPFWRAVNAIIGFSKGAAAVIFAKFQEDLEQIAEETEDETFSSFLSLFIKIIVENDPFEEPGASE